MTEKSIIFLGEDVRNILKGKKTQTRRVIKPQPPSKNEFCARCPYGQPGDRLWVKESYSWVTLAEQDPWDKGLFSVIRRVPIDYEHDHAGCKVGMIYRATDGDWDAPWIPSVKMPRWASRITLEIVNIRVERLQEIDYKDARAEGMPLDYSGLYDFNWVLYGGYQANFRRYWDFHHTSILWERNPFVWVIEFKKFEERREI